MIKYTTEYKDTCYFCGKQVSENIPHERMQVQIGNLSTVLSVKIFPICLDCQKILDKYLEHETRLALHGGVVEE